ALNDAREMQKSSSDDYITLFEKAWKNNANGTELWRIFNNLENQDKFPAKTSDADVIKILRAEAEDAINNTENIIRKRIDQFGVTQPNVQKQSLTGRILVELPGVDDRERVRKNLKSTANLEFWDCYFNQEVIQSLISANEKLGKKLAPQLFSSDSLRSQKDSLMNVALADTTLNTAQQDSIRKFYADNTVIPDSLLSKEDLRKKNPLFSYLNPNMPQGSAMIGLASVSDTAQINKYLNMAEAKNALPADLRLLWGAKSNNNVAQLYAIRDLSGRGKAELDGKSIVDARQDFDPIKGDVTVEMRMDSEKGTPVWRDWTKKNASDRNRPIAIVMDNLVYSAPSVNQEIPNGSSVITFGDDTDREKSIQEARDLAGLLKAGSLPAPAKIIDEVTVGPSLGEKNIQAGLWSFLIAFIVILIYMIFYYAWAGWAANVALIANLFFLIGALVSLHGALTLPGIAGIVLTMGMAVDANVLIYERVKEELRHGKPIAVAMKDGFLKAISAIIDGNATTLLTGIVLLMVGTGPIKGFATTLIIGIFTTLFTAIIIARLILYKRLDSKKEITFSSKITKNWFTKVNYDFVGKRKLYYFISLAIVVAGLVSWTVRGFNLGVDFVGGTSFKIEFVNQVDADALRGALEEKLVDNNGTKAAVLVQAVGTTGKEFKVTTNYLIDSTDPNADELVTSKVEEAVKSISPDAKMDSSYKVDATMSDDFRKEAIWAGLIALILVGIYIFIRFRAWDFAIGASVALFHDALVVIAAFTLLNGIVPFSLEVNQNFIGAILTIIGFSINDTVVIFDRIREYLRANKSEKVEVTINNALNSTMGRTLNTSMTVLLTLIVMFIFGSDDIKGFTFAMIIGVISGVYSTLFIATPIVIDMRKFFASKNASAEADSKA
ncbi:MAG: protein translocase subunit SecD, partial [Flavobacteriales bacterium]